MLTCPPPYSPFGMSPSKLPYSSGWSSVRTARWFVAGSSGIPLGSAHDTRTPSRSRRKSQCRARAWCSWMTNTGRSSPRGPREPAVRIGSGVLAGSRLARYAPIGPSSAMADSPMRLLRRGHPGPIPARTPPTPRATRAQSGLRLPDGSAQLLDADQVARGIAECAVANPVRLLGRLLDDLGSAGLHLLEGAVEVGGGQQDPAVGALGHHLDDGAALVVGDPRVGGRRRPEDGRAGLAGGADRDPAHLAVSDVAADLEAEGVAIEGQGGVRVVVREEARVNGDVHGGQASCGSVTRASRFLIGLVSECPGILAAERQARRLLRRCTIVTATAGLSPGAAVLEVGCGTGQLTERLASSGFRLTAIDIGASMIAAARQRLAGAEVSFQVTSFEDLAAVDASFDLVISSAAFHWIDPEVAFSKSARLLRPGGWLALLGTEEHYDDPLGEALDVLWVTHGDTGGAWERRPSDPEAFSDDREPDVAIPQPAPERAANLQFFLASDAPAAHRYQLDIPALKAAAAQNVPAP